MNGELPQGTADPLPGHGRTPALSAPGTADYAAPLQAPRMPGEVLERLLVPQALEAFAQLHGDAYLRYTHLMLGDHDLAKEIVDTVFEVVAVHWEHILNQEQKPEAYGWAVLQEFIDATRAEQGRTWALTRTAAFDAALRPMQDCFEALESGIGLYNAISRLPQRQCAAIILRYALGYPTPRVAMIMGVMESSVRSLLRYAKRSLADMLGLDHRPDSTKED